MLIVDGHLDLAMNALYLNRDLRLSAHQLRERELSVVGTHSGLGRGTVGFPDLRTGGIGLSLVTLIARVKPESTSYIDFATHQIADAHGRGQLAWYRAHERAGDLCLLETSAALDSWLAGWEREPEGSPLGMVLCMEGADPIVDPSELELWWNAGLRVISLAHYGSSAYAVGTHSDGPLTESGRVLLGEMERLGVILDVTHLCDASFWEAMERFDGVVCATHSNSRALVPNDRQFSDPQLKALIERDAVIATALDAWMLQPDWVIGSTSPGGLTLEAVVDQIEHVCHLSGNTRHAAIGSDLDGGYGTEQTPGDLDTIADLSRIPDLLAARGFGDDDIGAVMHGNWLRLLRRGLPQG